MILYHGSNVKVDMPRLLGQTRGLDFGAGFYLTSKKEQAVSFSKSVCRRAKSGIPFVSVYEFDESVAEQELEILRFTQADEDWLDFVKQNRLKSYNKKQYDIIIGPVADDAVLPTIQAFIIGQFTADAALAALKTSRLFDQYCLATDKAIALLKFVECFTPQEVE